MIIVRAPVAGEIERLGKSASEAWIRDAFMVDQFSGQFDRPFSTLLLIDGVPISAGGFFDQGGGFAFAWLLVSLFVEPRHLFAICRTCRRGMMAAPFKRIEAHCLDNPQSHRLVRAIGFECIAGKYYTPDGRPFSRFLFRNQS